jgi:hypothetical protein
VTMMKIHLISFSFSSVAMLGMGALTNGAFAQGLVTFANASGPFTFTGIYATNSVLPGGIGPDSYEPSVPGWAPGATMFYEVVGWYASLGATFNAPWVTNDWLQFPQIGYFGVSPIASGVAGGIGPQATLSASVSGDRIVVSWTPIGGTLQYSPSLGAGETWSTVGTANPTTVTNSASAKFFRVAPYVYPNLNLFGPSGLQGLNLLPVGKSV